MKSILSIKKSILIISLQLIASRIYANDLEYILDIGVIFKSGIKNINIKKLNIPTMSKTIREIRASMINPV